MNEKIFEKIGQKIASNLVSTKISPEKIASSNIEQLYLPKTVMNLNFKNSFVFELPVLAEKLSSVKYIDYVKEKFESALASGAGFIIFSIQNFSLKTKFGHKNLKELFEFIIKSAHCQAVKIFNEIGTAYGRTDSNNLFLNRFKISASSCKDGRNSNSINKHPTDMFLGRLSRRIQHFISFLLTCGFDGLVLDLSSCIAGELSSIEFNNLMFGKYNEIQDFALKILNYVAEFFKNLPLICRLNLSSMTKELFGTDYMQIRSISRLRNLTDFSLIFDFIKKLVSGGADGFIFSFGTNETAFLHDFPAFLGENLFSDFNNLFLNQCFDLNLINKFGEPPFIINNDNYSSISNITSALGRQIPFAIATKDILADKNFVSKVRNNEEILNCIKCLECKNNFCESGHFDCIFKNFNYINSNSSKARNVCVVGSGISGLVCAIVLANRGHFVEMFEKNIEINRNGKLNEIFGLDRNFSLFNQYLSKEIERLVSENKIKIHLGETFEYSNKIDLFDDIVIATGFHENNFNVNGAVLKQVMSIYDALFSKATFLSVNKVTILAKTELSLKLAVYLLSKNISVSIIIENSDLIKDLPDEKFSYYMQVFYKYRAEIYPLAKLNVINEDCSEVIYNHRFLNKNSTILMYNLRSKTKYRFIPQIKTIFHDIFIFEPELTSNNKLLYEIVTKGYLGNVFMIGNALKIDTLSEDIKSAIYVATNI